ncbi:MAG: hypothetical protein A3A73_00870 [Omnitrophica bacterium RIFCSPLOWO2_01_FULL_50_24]|nr:MAG: hypothetical protein A3A73_00870 [Omnitrophica bacterium RIFCSPLOWO2_01_FULL_50_24]
MQESRMGGIEHNSFAIAKRAKDQGIEICFLCPNRGLLTQLLRETGIQYVVLSRPPFLSTSIRIGSRSVLNPIAIAYDSIIVFVAAFQISIWMKRHRPPLVVTKGLLANVYGSIAARMAGIPALWDVQEIVRSARARGALWRFLNALAKFLPTHLSVSSEAARDQFDAVLHRKISVIPNGISLKRFHPRVDRNRFRTELGVDDDTCLVGHVGRFTYWKGQMEFVNAASEVHERYPRVRFVLVGSPVFENDAYERSVKQYVKEQGLGSCIFFRDYRMDLEYVLASLDIYVHSSIEPEGCSLTLLYAMAMEKAVVVTAVQGNDEVVTDGVNGVLVAPKSHTAITEAVLTLVNDPLKRQALGKRARELVKEKFDLERSASNTLALYQQFLKDESANS